MRLFIACHNDDEALFGAYTLMRQKPLVVVVTDGIIHQQRFGIDPSIRRQESRNACKIAGCRVQFLGIPDNDVNKADLRFALSKYKPYKVYAPAIDGGNATHDLVSDVAWQLWGKKCVFYTTYSKTAFRIKGDTEIIPTREELDKKIEMLKCYKSQLGINKPHFDAVWGKSEFYE